MGFTGLIFGAIAVFWLVYLVPFFLRHRGEELEDDVDPAIPFTPAVTIVRSGSSLAESDPGTVAVSTPLTRRARLRELKLRQAAAAQRRRQVLAVLLAAQMIVASLVFFGVTVWWTALVPFALIIAFVVVARFSVRAMRAQFDRAAEEIRSVPEEETVALSLSDVDAAAHEHSIELSVPVGAAGSLWDPIPITRPTYVSTPLAPRTVRTIDLSAPVPDRTSVPVTADAITPAEADADVERTEDVG
jgi:Ca2+/Na+ antiporter